MDGEPFGMVDVVGALPLEPAHGEGQITRRPIEQRRERVPFEDLVRQARSLAAAATLEHCRHRFDLAFGIADRELQSMRQVVGRRLLAVQFLPSLEEGRAEVEHGVVADQDLTPTAVNGHAGHDHYVLLATGGIGMFEDFQAAHRPPAMEVLIVAAILAHEIELLVEEILRRHDLAVEQGVAGKLRDLAFGAVGISLWDAGVFHGPDPVIRGLCRGRGASPGAG